MGNFIWPSVAYCWGFFYYSTGIHWLQACFEILDCPRGVYCWGRFDIQQVSMYHGYAWRFYFITKGDRTANVSESDIHVDIIFTGGLGDMALMNGTSHDVTSGGSIGGKFTIKYASFSRRLLNEVGEELRSPRYRFQYREVDLLFRDMRSWSWWSPSYGSTSSWASSWSETNDKLKGAFSRRWNFTQDVQVGGSTT